MEDSEAIAALVNSAYRGDTSRQGWTTEADFLDGQRTDEEMLQEEIAQPGNAFLLFEEAGKLIGCVSLKKKDNHAYLGMFTVTPHLQARGVGKEALELTENWIKKTWNLSRVEIVVITKRLELIAWYERRGYRDTGRREPFPSHDPKLGLPKVDDLEMMVLEKNLGA